MGAAPPEEDMPRISNSVWPGPAVRTEIPGTAAITPERFVMPSCCMSSPVIAVMLMGVVMVTSSTIILSKTLRDQHEGAKLHNKIEEAQKGTARQKVAIRAGISSTVVRNSAAAFFAIWIVLLAWYRA